MLTGALPADQAAHCRLFRFQRLLEEFTFSGDEEADFARLEREGILTRTVRNAMPPHVSYALTPMGRTLREATAPLLEWSIAHLTRIDAARAAYDTRPTDPPA